MIKTRFPLFLLTIFVALVALLLVLGPLQAQPAPQAGGAAAVLEVVATDLVNPRGLAFGPDGSLYIAESGVGGAGPCMPGRGVEICYGSSGGITRVEFDAEGQPADQTQIISGLSSLAAKDTGDDATGPNDVAVSEAGDLFYLMGLGNDPAVRDPAGPLGAAGMDFGQLVAVDDEMNRSNVADVAGYEGTNNPDGAQIDSNPFGMELAGTEFKVTDAGGNSLLNVTGVFESRRLATTADISTLGVFPVRMVEASPGGPILPMDAVPTAVEVGPDGAYYVSQLTGFPFPVGGANIYRVEPGEEPQVYLAGFTNVLDLAFGPDGSLFVLEMAKDGLQADPPPDGRIIQVTPYGARITLAEEGLIAPVDMEVGPDHALYVINLGPTPMGQVVRIPLPSSTITLPAAQDNTLYESATGNVSNGMGQHFFAGLTDIKMNFAARRAVIAFDVAGSLPAGSKVISASLELHLSRTISGDKDVTLHTVDKAWGEGASDAGGEEGGGDMAAPGDATWLYSEYDTVMWSTAGGDFNPSASATTSVGGIGDYSWSGDQLTADVQAWSDGTADNYGWLIMGDEASNGSAKRFDSREHPQAENRPELIIHYVAPLPDYAVFLPVIFSAE